MLEQQLQFYYMKHSDKEITPDIGYLDITYPDIKYLDNHILVVNKPPNLLTQPNDSQNLSLEEVMKDFIKKKFSKKGKNIFLHAIHRLDKQTSGLVLFARTSKALSRLNEMMRKKKITRKYIALVEGIFFKNKKGTLVHYLIHKNYKAQIVDKNNKKAKRAELTYKVIEEINNNSLVEINLLTGRYHQIRAQFSFIGHPVVGDKKYKSSIEASKIELNCFYLEFEHPIKKGSKKLVFLADGLGRQP